MRTKDKLLAYKGSLVVLMIQLMGLLCKLTNLQRIHQSILIKLVKRTHLFNREFYLEENDDVVSSEMLPLRHYVVYGDREGRNPMELFDTVYYRQHARGLLRGTNALLHYHYIGRYLRNSPSPWFDTDYYLSNNKDVARRGSDPLYHFVMWGGLEGRSPCSDFDCEYYIRRHPEVTQAGENPLLHYLHSGRLGNNAPLPREHGTEECDTYQCDQLMLSPPAEEEWALLSPRVNQSMASIDVVIPVYKGYVETLRCIYSVLASKDNTAYQLIVINDASPDVALVNELEILANRGLFTLLTNDSNLGFVHTVNRGMRLHSERDILLLNADTIVHDGWLERIAAAAIRNPRTGTVTPLSNSATICSYPHFLHDNPAPLELSYGELDRLTAELNAGSEVEAPTGIGFCMYIKRVCLDEVGLFDEQAFGKGYGEENDFCQRAIIKGWRNIIAADTFVYHWGSTSFKGEKAKRVEAALKVVNKRYPGYQRDVADFIKRDPLKLMRMRLDNARIERMKRERNVLIVTHNRGGGTERHVQEDIEQFISKGYGVFLLRPVKHKPAFVQLSHPQLKFLPNREEIAFNDTSTLGGALRDLNITEIHTHGLVDFLPDAPRQLCKLAAAMDGRLEINLHDYKVICPRINLTDGDGCYCHEPDERHCNICLKSYGSDFNVTDITQWRTMHHQVLGMADEILVPDIDMAQRLRNYFPDFEFKVSPHDSLSECVSEMQLPQISDNEKLRVVLIGAISRIKGYDVLLSVARWVKKKKLPVEFVVMGYSMNDAKLRNAGVVVTGKYHETDALKTLNSLEPHLIWLPSIWPETFSYTLSIAMQANFPVTAFDIGAISSRLRQCDRDQLVVPLSLSKSSADLARFFVEQRTRYIQNTK